MHLKPDGTSRQPGRFFPTTPRRRWSILLLSAVLCACSRKASEPAAGRRGATGGAVPVVVAEVVAKDVPLTLASIGAVESIRTIAIKSLVSGALLKVNFQEGQEVRKGDLLFEIDPRPYQNALRSAEANREKTRAQLEMANTQVARYTSLLAGGMVSKEQFENLQNTSHTLQAALASNEADIANAALQLEYCQIRAPCDGRTGALGAHEGDLVRASDPSTALVTVTQLTPVYVTFALPQQNLSLIQKFQALAPVGILASPSASDAPPEKGEVTFLDSSVDAATGTIRLKATFANSGHRLWPGSFVRVSLTLATLPNQIVVPTPAVQTGQKGPQVYVVRQDNTVELRPVVVDRNEPGSTIIARGLKPGETVVVDGQIRLRPNATVSIRPAVEEVPSVRAASRPHRAADTSEANHENPATHPPSTN